MDAENAKAYTVWMMSLPQELRDRLPQDAHLRWPAIKDDPEAHIDAYVYKSIEEEHQADESVLEAMKNGTSFTWSKDVYRDDKGRLRRKAALPVSLAQKPTPPPSRKLSELTEAEFEALHKKIKDKENQGFWPFIWVLLTVLAFEHNTKAGVIFTVLGVALFIWTSCKKD